MLIDKLSKFLYLKVLFTQHIGNLHLVKLTPIQKIKSWFWRWRHFFSFLYRLLFGFLLLFMNNDMFLFLRSPVLLLQGLAVVLLILGLMNNLCIKLGNPSIPSPLLYNVR